MGEQKREGTVRVKDADIYYRTIGRGMPVVLLHGNGENHKAFAGQVKALRGSYQLILIDSRGHGRSSLGYRGLNFPSMAEDIMEVLNHLEIPRAVVLGFSDGANLALQFAILYPEQVQGLILISGNWYPKGMKRWFYWSVKAHYCFFRLAARFHWKVRRKRELYGLMANQPRFTREEMQKIAAPALVIAGDKDIIRESHTRELADLLSNSRLEIIENAGHMSVYQKPERYNRAIIRFLRGLERQ